MKIVKSLLFVALIFVFSGLLSQTTVYASGEVNSTATSPVLSLNPSSGFTGVGDEFWVDIMLDTKGNKSISTRAVVLFDFNYVELTKVEKGSLYCTYPEEGENGNFGSSNKVGYIVVTGYCSATPADTSGAQIFATLHFKAKKVGSTTMEFRYSGQDQTGYTVVYNTNSPPANILTSKPSGGAYKIVTNADAYTVTNPNTSTIQSKLAYAGLLILGVILIILSIYLSIRRKVQSTSKI